jgi:Fe-S cluster biogenesis protein NfuA
MSSESTSETPLQQRLELFMTRNFPQIWMHGGGASIDALDEETGELWISLTGACVGCGISRATVGALEMRLRSEFPELETVQVSTDGGFDYGDAGASGAPF